MRFMTVVLCAALLTIGAGGASAGSAWLGGTVGAGIPTDRYGDVAATGWHLGTTGTYMLDDRYGVGGDVAYHSWGASDDMTAALEGSLGPGSKMSFSAIQGTVHGLVKIPAQGNMFPYATLGLGLYHISGSLQSPAGDATESSAKFGINFGGGVDFLTTGAMRWGLAAQYHLVKAGTDVADADFATVGLKAVWGIPQK